MYDVEYGIKCISHTSMVVKLNIPSLDLQCLIKEYIFRKMYDTESIMITDTIFEEKNLGFII